MQERKVLLTHEAINDIVDAEVYINGQFGEARAGRYRADIKKVLRNLSVEGTIYSESGFYYRNYIIYKKPFPPAIIFWIIRQNSIHVLRILRESYNWQRYFRTHRYYEYTYSNLAII